MGQNPLVSVRVVTYNHEQYLAKCLEGILMQRTTFPFEVIVGEDCSTDNTRVIAQSYADRYPDIIRLITSETNVGCTRNLQRVLDASRGKYHAICEGDDIWIDPLKLQKQVDFLETHPDYSLCFHDVFLSWIGKTSWPRYYCPKDQPETVILTDVIQYPCFIPTVSILMRATVVQTYPVLDREVWCRDLITRLWAARQGKLGYLDEMMAIHLRVPTGLTNTVETPKKFEDTIYVLNVFDKETDFQYTDLIQQRIRQIQQEYAEVRMKKRFGNLYLLMNPGKVLRKLRDYAANSRW